MLWAGVCPPSGRNVVGRRLPGPVATGPGAALRSFLRSHPPSQERGSGGEGSRRNLGVERTGSHVSDLRLCAQGRRGGNTRACGQAPSGFAAASLSLSLPLLHAPLSPRVEGLTISTDRRIRRSRH